MGNKYQIYGFNYPYKGVVDEVKQTKFFLVALFWFAVGCLKYDGVNVMVRRLLMNRVDCENCKNYFNWSDVSVLPDKNGLFVKKIVLNEVCCKVNKEIKNIKRCNSYEEAETKKEEVVEEKIEEIKPEPKIEEPKTEEPKKEISKIAEGRRKKR